MLLIFVTWAVFSSIHSAHSEVCGIQSEDNNGQFLAERLYKDLMSSNKSKYKKITILFTSQNTIIYL